MDNIKDDIEKLSDIKEYEEALKKHDWYYMMSEDINVYESGKAMHNRLLRLTILTAEHKKLFTKYSEKIKYGI